MELWSIISDYCFKPGMGHKISTGQDWIERLDRAQDGPTKFEAQDGPTKFETRDGPTKFQTGRDWTEPRMGPQNSKLDGTG